MNAIALLAAAALAHGILAQSLPGSRTYSSQIVVPQTRSFAPASGGVEVTGVTASIDIANQVATTTLDLALTNRTGARLESRLVLPAPQGAALREFAFQGASAEPKVELLAREEARRAYDAIVASVRDPALLEFLGCNLIQSSVFPVEARSGQKVRIVYEQLLPRDGDRVDYLLPRTESIEYRVPWEISVRIQSRQPLASVYSPSHRLDVRRHGTKVTARVTLEARTEPGPFRLSYLAGESEMAATLLAYPDAKIGGGYFLLLAGLPESPRAEAEAIEREVILVLDRSGSMAGEKLEQARAAALQVLEGLGEGESFNIVVYNESVSLFSSEPVVKNAETMRAARAFLRTLRVSGGTNIHDALQEALRMRSRPGVLPLVLFLTDGLPTVGQTSEMAIRELAAKGNPRQRRVFTFGVGLDVNTPLLDRIAVLTRGSSTYVLPNEDVEVKVGQVFRRLAHPVLAAPALKAVAGDGKPAPGRVRDLLPARLPDLFEGDQLVLLGQYVGEEPLAFELRGDRRGRERAHRFEFAIDRASTRNAFVARLWASRKVAVLTDAIRELGADGSGAGDPRLNELVREVVRLSKEFGILTEYTAFLAREGTDLAQHRFVLQESLNNFDRRGLKTRSGLDSISQSLNNGFKRAQEVENYRNKLYDAQMNAVEIATVQQVNDRAFFKKGGRWIESELADNPGEAHPRIVRFGTEEFRRLAERLAEENRQGVLMLKGEMLLRVGGETLLVR